MRKRLDFQAYANDLLASLREKLALLAFKEAAGRPKADHRRRGREESHELVSSRWSGVFAPRGKGAFGVKRDIDIWVRV